MENFELNRQINIALLAPYSGTNLGDGAIQTAAIENFRKVNSNISLYGITLNPRDTEARHCIPCYPITGLVVKMYSWAQNIYSARETKTNPKVGKTQQAASGEKNIDDAGDEQYSSIRMFLKDIPFLVTCIHFARRSIFNVINILSEIRAIACACSFARKLDLIVVSGSGQINDEWGGPWGLPYSLCRWALIAKVTNTKFAIASVGSGTLRPLSKIFMGVALKSACYRSYRDVGTKLFVDRWSFTRNDPCIPDLAFSLDLPSSNFFVQKANGKMRVGIAPISYGHPSRWPIENHNAYNSYLKELTAFIVWLTRNGHDIVFFTSSGADQAAVADIEEILKALEHKNDEKILDSCSFPIVDTTTELLECIEGVDCVIASRLHSVVMSHLLSKPTIAISFDRKVNAQMEMMNQLDICFEIQEFVEDNLRDSFIMLLDKFQDLEKEIYTRVQKYKSEVLPQYEKLVATI